MQEVNQPGQLDLDETKPSLYYDKLHARLDKNYNNRHLTEKQNKRKEKKKKKRIQLAIDSIIQFQIFTN